jgi:hypothetical protein
VNLQIEIPQYPLNYLAIIQFILLEFYKMEIRKNLKSKYLSIKTYHLIAPNQKVNRQIGKFNSLNMIKIIFKKQSKKLLPEFVIFVRRPRLAFLPLLLGHGLEVLVVGQSVLAELNLFVSPGQGQGIGLAFVGSLAASPLVGSAPAHAA